VHPSFLDSFTKEIVRPLIEKRGSEIAEAEDNGRVPILWAFQLEAEDYLLDDLFSDISEFVKAVNSGGLKRPNQTRQASKELAAAVKDLHSLTSKALDIDQQVRGKRHVKWVKGRDALARDLQKMQEQARTKGS
jgi:hypothetical protein